MKVSLLVALLVQCAEGQGFANVAERFPSLRGVASWLPLDGAWEDADPELDPLIKQIEAHAGSNLTRSVEDRHEALEAGLRPLIMALPKNPAGKLGPEAVRYTLHRFFLQRHAWFVKGLSPNGAAWNSSSPTELLNGHVSPQVKALFEAQLQSTGLGIHEIALLAAMLEQSVHDEQLRSLRSAFQLVGASMDGDTEISVVDQVIDLYLAAHVAGYNLSVSTPGQHKFMMEHISAYYPAFPLTRDFARQVRGEVVGNASTTMTFAETAAVVRTIGSRYGRFQNGECVDLKRKLLSIGDNSTGCVKLTDFYGSMVNDGNWELSETPELLREQGILEESDPSNPHVLVANYMNSATNCVAHSDYYSVCCINECDDMYGLIEKRIQAPYSTPNELVRVISSLAPKGILKPVPITLELKLREVADQNRGMVPIYGRLFAQWMHHMFPRECPFPHLAGATVFHELWKYDLSAGLDRIVMSPEAAQKYNKALHKSSAPTLAADRTSPVSLGACSAWRNEEEVFVPTWSPPPSIQQLESEYSVRVTVYVVAMVSFGVMILVIVLRASSLLTGIRHDGKGARLLKLEIQQSA